MARVTIDVTFNRFPEIARALPVEADKVVRKTAFDIEGRAKDLAPVDTGALKNSIYVKFGGGESTYNRAQVAASTMNPESGLLPEMARPEAHTATIGPAVEYGIFLEFGTRSMPAQPYMTPAAEAARGAFIAAMKQMLNRL